MIGKTSRGKGFYGTYHYVLREGDPERQPWAYIIGGNMAGWNAQTLSQEVRPVRRIKPEIKQPVWHVSLSFHPEEVLSDGQLQTISDRFLDEMGDRRRHQHLYVRHQECAHGHVHLVVNRIADDGKVFDVHNDYYRTKAATRKLEQDLGLRPTVERGKDPAFQAELRSRLEETATPGLPLSRFCQQLASQRITPIFTVRRGKLSGLSYHYQGSEVRGSRLGKGYSLQGLQRELGIDYQPGRDDGTVRPEYVRRKGQTPPALLRQRASPDSQAEPIAELADFLADLLTTLECQVCTGNRYRAAREENTLTLTRRSSGETLMKATWDEANATWQANEPGRLRPDDITYLQDFAQRFSQQQAEAQKQQQRAAARRRQQRSREPELEL